MAVTWHKTPMQAMDEYLNAETARIERGVIALARQYAPEIEAHMKANHPWQNQTGMAEEGLETQVIVIARQAVIILMTHGVDYSVFIETMQSGRFGILLPTLDLYMPRIWRDVQHMMRGSWGFI